MIVQPRVRGPQPGVRLTHRSYGILHCARAHRLAAGSERAGAITLCKTLQEGDKLVSRQAAGVEVQELAKGLPKLPGCVGGGMALCRNPFCGRLLDSAPVKAECVSTLK